MLNRISKALFCIALMAGVFTLEGCSVSPEKMKRLEQHGSTILSESGFGDITFDKSKSQTIQALSNNSAGWICEAWSQSFPFDEPYLVFTAKKEGKKYVGVICYNDLKMRVEYMHIIAAEGKKRGDTFVINGSGFVLLEDY